MSEETNDLTPEEEMLVKCLKGQKIPKDQSTVGHYIPSEQIQGIEHIRNKRDKLTDVEEGAKETEIISTVEERPLEVVVQELRDEICSGMDTIRGQVEALQMDDLSLFLQALEKILLDMVDVREKVLNCIQEQKQLDARNAVAELIEKGFLFKRIQIDDICFAVGEDKDIQICEKQ